MFRGTGALGWDEMQGEGEARGWWAERVKEAGKELLLVHKISDFSFLFYLSNLVSRKINPLPEICF